MKCDIKIINGLIIDPSQNIHDKLDIIINDSLITKITKNSEVYEPVHLIDASDCIITPGLIDLHVHVYPHCPLGINCNDIISSSGVTTMLDAGSSGTSNFHIFKENFIDKSKNSILCLINLSRIGLIADDLGELVDRRYADKKGCIDIINNNKEIVSGVKIRAGSLIIGTGENALSNLNDAIEAARETQTSLMVHIGECPIPIPNLLNMLSEGDCITHCFKSGSSRITNDLNKIYDQVHQAKEDGIYFDVGHGYGSFCWDVAEKSLEQGFSPNTISTDLHIKNINGPVYDMPTTMSKFLMLGLSIDDVVKMSTYNPAKFLNKEKYIGTLKENTIADITVLETIDGKFKLNDSYKKTRITEKLLIAAVTIKNGSIIPGGGGRRMRINQG